jgi:hypothetical protein
LVEYQLPKLNADVVSDENEGTSELAKSNPSRFPSTENTEDPLSSIDADLKWLLFAWPRMTSQIRAGIVALARAALDSD